MLVLVLHTLSATKNVPLVLLKKHWIEEKGTENQNTLNKHMGACVGSGGGGIIQVVAVFIHFQL